VSWSIFSINPDDRSLNLPPLRAMLLISLDVNWIEYQIARVAPAFCCLYHDPMPFRLNY